MKGKTLIFLFLIAPLLLSLIILIFSLKGCLLFYGLFNLGLYIHITITTLSNALLGKGISAKVDILWKLVFLFITCFCLTLFFII